MVDLVPDEKDFDQLESKKAVLMDLEGALTSGERYVPRDPNPQHVYKMFEGEDFEVKTDLGYWSGLHLLAGEKPSEYFTRVDRWRNGQLSREKFEEKNINLLNKIIRRTENDSAGEVIEWYNTQFLNLRDQSQELVDIFKDEEYSSGIISHTSQSLSKKAAEKLGMEFIVPTWKFETEYGDFSDVIKTKYADDKSHIVDELHDAGIEKIVFIGNGKNDVDIAEAADEAYMIENHDGVKYKDVDATTGTFDEVMQQIKQSVKGEK